MDEIVFIQMDGLDVSIYDGDFDSLVPLDVDWVHVNERVSAVASSEVVNKAKSKCITVFETDKNAVRIWQWEGTRWIKCMVQPVGR